MEWKQDIVAQMDAADVAEANTPEVDASATDTPDTTDATDETATEEAGEVEGEAGDEYEEAATSNDPPKKFVAKSKGEEVEVSIYNEDGSINQEVIEGYNMRFRFHQRMEELAHKEKELDAMRAELAKGKGESTPDAGSQEEKDLLADYDQDDPLVVAFRRQQAKNDSLQASVAEIKNYINAKSNQESVEALAKLEAEIRQAHNFNDTEMEMAAKIFMGSKELDGNDADYKAVARKLADFKKQAVAEWKAKNLKPKNQKQQAAAGVPTTGTGTPKLKLGDRSIIEHCYELDRMAKSGG